MAEKLNDILKQYGKVAVAFSGGTDSTLLASVALQVLGHENVLLIFADSVFTPQAERDFALKWAAKHNFSFVVADFDPLSLEDVAVNDPERCYHCKKAIFGKALNIAQSHGFDILCDGTNLDDFGDYRPGLKACDELGIKHPLSDAGMNKSDVRELSCKMGNQNWNRPASACLASRVPTGRSLEAEYLKRIDAAEDVLREYGFTGVRARLAGTAIRIELPSEQIPTAAAMHLELTDQILALGFTGVWLDLLGYRRGSANAPE